MWRFFGLEVGRVVATYDYRDEHGVCLYRVERLVPRELRACRPDGEDGWVYSLNGVRRVLYRLPQVLEAVEAGKPVVVVGSEEGVEALEALGVVATTNPGGAGKWRREYADALRGANVKVVAQANEPGRKHALTVACDLDAVASEVKLYEPAPPHRDIAEHLKAGLRGRDLVRFDRGAVQRALEEQRAKAKGRMGVVSVRDFMARPSLNGDAQVLGPMLWRTMRTTVGASTGDGKTTWACQMIRAIVCREPFLTYRGSGKRALIVDVEQGEETVKQRLRDVGLHDHENVDLIWEPDGLALDSSKADRQYVEDALRRGRYDVALFDPLYQLHCGDENSERTAADVMRVLDDWARRFNFAAIIPMHRRKPHAQAGLNAFTINDIGGHGAWVRNSEIVLGLQVVRPGLSRLHFFKDRPGFLPGIGGTWELAFDRGAHRFERAGEADEPNHVKVRQMLTGQPGLTIQQLADELALTTGTIRNHLRKVGAQCEDEKVGASSRWAMTPWPARQPSLLEAPDGDPPAAV